MQAKSLLQPTPANIGALLSVTQTYRWLPCPAAVVTWCAFFIRRVKAEPNSRWSARPSRVQHNQTPNCASASL